VKSTDYSLFSLRIFQWLIKDDRKERLEEKNLLLEKANINMEYPEFFAWTLMNIIIAIICSVVFSVVFHLILNNIFSLVLLIIVPISVPCIIGLLSYYLPDFRIKKRGHNIDLYLPYAINFISSMAVAGISPSEIFTTLSTIDVYGEVQVEAKNIAKEINIMGVDNISALKNAIETTPSDKFKAFLQGIIGTIQSGSDLHVYLSTIVEKYMEADLVDRKKDLDLLAVIAEVFVISVIAFPIFLVIILTVFGFFGGSMDLSISLMLIFSFLILPLVYAGFYYLIQSTSLEEITKMKSKRVFTLREYMEENKASMYIIGLSTCFLIILYVFLLLFSFLGYIPLTLYQQLDFLFLAILFFIGPIGVYKYLEIKRRKEMQNRLPEFLTEVGDSLSTGMTIFDAIKTASKSRYGRFTDEIRLMKSQLSWDISMTDVLHEFASRMNSAIVQRIVIVINRGLVMGGKTPKIFKAASREVDQVNRLERQRETNMYVYTIVILMCFFIFLAIIVILDRTIFMSFFDLQNQQVQRLGNFMMISPVDSTVLKYTLFSFVFVQSIGAGVLAGFMMDGKLASGIRYSCLLGLISFFIFKFLF
jgi:flagellar protein FlaJ